MILESIPTALAGIGQYPGVCSRFLGSILLGLFKTGMALTYGIEQLDGELVSPWQEERK